MTGFGTRLHAAVDRRGPLCVGIDPHPPLLAAWGLADDAAGCETFARTVVDAVGAEVAAVKPQSAFFERFGSAGIAVLERTIATARDAGAVVLLDAKRGDIGSTVRAYADAYLNPTSPMCADAVTASPYLGFGALGPLVQTARAHGNGVFVLALTSNPEGAQVQAARTSDGRTVGRSVLDAVAEANAEEVAAGAPWGSVGAVVGATLNGGLPGDLDGLGGPILAPGIGAQGAMAADLPAVFGRLTGDVLPAVSRELLRHGPDVDALRHAAVRMRDELRAVISGGRD